MTWARAVCSASMGQCGGNATVANASGAATAAAVPEPAPYRGRPCRLLVRVVVPARHQGRRTCSGKRAGASVCTRTCACSRVHPCARARPVRTHQRVRSLQELTTTPPSRGIRMATASCCSSCGCIGLLLQGQRRRPRIRRPAVAAGATAGLGWAATGAGLLVGTGCCALAALAGPNYQPSHCAGSVGATCICIATAQDAGAGWGAVTSSSSRPAATPAPPAATPRPRLHCPRPQPHPRAARMRRSVSGCCAPCPAAAAAEEAGQAATAAEGGAGPRQPHAAPSLAQPTPHMPCATSGLTIAPCCMWCCTLAHRATRAAAGAGVRARCRRRPSRPRAWTTASGTWSWWPRHSWRTTGP